MDTAEKIFARLAPGCKKTMGKGENLFHQGGPVESIYVIDQGKIRLSRCTLDGNSAVLQLAAAGEMIAEASLFSDQYHCMASVIGQSACIIRFDRDTVIAALRKSPDIMMQLLELFGHQIREQRTILEIRNIRSAKQRMLTYFLLVADANQQVLLHSSLKDTAYQLGLAHETFYRGLKKLEHEGKLERKEGVIYVCPDMI